MLVNMYGITETTVHTTYHRITRRDLEPGAGNPVGRPLGDLTVHLLDPRGQLVPVGVPGEIHVGGPGVARGYLNRPELTAERFVPDPFGPPGSRLYRSGDLARRRPDGSLDFLGRADDQVKIRGYRIELGEIEAALATHPDVREAVVLAREDTPGDKRLVAYCVAPADADLPAGAELAAHCGAVLPPYMVPAAFVALDALPLTANGKLDRRALPAPGDDAFARAAYTAPRTPAEERIAAVWRDVLGADRVGVHDNFFDLGGDSISAVALVGALREQRLDVSVGDVFAHRTVGELAALLATRAGLAHRDEPVAPFALLGDEDRAKLPAGLADAYPMSLVQTGMVVEMLGGGDAYRSFVSYRISDRHPFSADALRAATALVVGRHELLRTSFDLHTYSVPMQLVHADADVPVTVHRVPTTGTGEDGTPGEELMDLLRAERDAAIDLGRAPLLRVTAYVSETDGAGGPGTDGTDGGWWLSIARPHAITEGWSHHRLLAELTGAYRRFRDGLAPEPYEAPAVRYADYIAAELASLDSEEDAAYWRDIVATHAPFTLPEGRRRDDGPGESYDVRIPLDDLEDSLRGLATRLRVSLKSVLLAAHAKVMSRFTEAPAFHLGLVCDGRPEMTGADRVYGMHLNTVPFPVDRTARTWRELITRVFDREAELWPHRRHPLPAVQRERRGGRLVTVAFNYVDLPRAQDGDGPDDTRADARFGVSQTEFDLTLHCRGDRMNLTTNTAVLSRADGERLRAMYRSVLEAMAADADGDARAAHLPDDERRLLLDERTATRRDPVDLSVPEEFQRHAARTPDAVALVSDDTATTYGELNTRANRLAHRLRELGVGPEVLVGICLERSPDLVLAVLAVLKAGGAYLPLDPESPAERLGFMADDAATRFLLTRRDLLTAVPAGGATTVLLDDEANWSGHPGTDPAPSAGQDGLAYVIYTSGSTGRPKGAMVRRDGMGNHLLAKIEDLGLGPGDSVVFNAPPAFDISVWQMLSALVTGGRVRVVDGDTAPDPKALFGRVADEAVTVLEVVPSLLRTALDLWDATGSAPALPALRRLVVTGEALPRDLCARWLARYPHIPLLNAYGPTECSDDVTHAVLADPAAEGRVPIGEPVRNTRLYVLDAWLQPVPSGVPGELYVGGAGVGRGYLNRPALTAERFVPDPFGPPGARLYRTGDLAAWRPDGGLDFLGRVDDQVKVRGHRVELGEIETALAAHPAVGQAVVVVRDERLVGYVTAAGGEPAGPEELRDRLARTLPDYMVPGAFVTLDAIPLTPNGKVDKRALPAPGDEAFVRGEYVAPRTDAERRMADAWRRSLDVERVGVRDGFFDLGGDSIRAVALVGALRAEGVDIAVRDVLEARTVERLCALVAGREGLTEADRTLTERFALVSDADRARLPQDVVDAYPLGRTQLGMLIEMIDGERNPYHIVNTFRVADDRPLDPDALRRAAAVLAERHEVLRTSFHLTGYSTPLQLVHATARIPVHVHDVRGLDEDALTAVRSELMRRQRAETFDVERAPLFRITAHDESDEAWWVTFTQSHAITEGWSYHQLLVELLDCYHAFRDGTEPAPYEVPEVRFADAIAAELASLESDADRAYWRRITSGHAPVVLPADWAGESDELLYQEVPFDDLGERLRELAATAGVSLKSVLLAAHMKVLGQITDEPAYHAGLVVDTRPEALGADRVLGMYLNTLPLAVDRSARTWRELVAQVYAREVELWEHRRYPMPVVQHEWGGGRLVNVYFNYIDFHQVDTGRVATGTRMTSATNEFDLTVFNRGDRLHVNTRASVMTRDHAERLAGTYRAVLEAMAADADGDARATCLPAGERERLLRQAGATADAAAGAHEPVRSCVHELFARQAARTPDAVAVVAGGTSLTYAELDARANRLAHRLRALGAGPERLVGVCLERGPDLLPALLGVLKSGAAYLPLDPANPADRLAHVLRDAGAAVLVAETGTLPLVEGVHDGPLVVLDRDADRAAWAAEPATAPNPPSGPDNAVYVIYTSGSTGRPKGVTLTHANVVRLMTTAQEHYAFDDADVWSMAHSYAFDVSVFEMWGALLHGGTLVVVPGEVTRSPEEFLDLLVEREVTVLSQTPSAFRSLVAAAAAGDERIGRLSLRAVVLAGERLETGELRPWTERLGLGRVALVNMYGITETTVHTTYHRITRRDLEPGAGNPIGRPLSDLTVHLLDPYGRLVPTGTRGEIHVGGPGVARGYLNRPELTAERFVPDPFGPPGSRLYKSGDLARRRPDGSLDFLGRIDDQVKIRGYRIELGEIETTLATHPDVREAVVLAREDTPGDKRLVGYVVPAGDTPPDPAALRDRLARTLPPYMVLAAYQVIDRVPLTPNGKLDRRALPAPGRDAFARAAYTAPRTPVEERVAALWREALGAERVGVHDAFFDLGGDSLKAVVIAGAMRAAGLDVTARDVLEHRTVEALCAGVSGRTAPTALITAVAPFALTAAEDRARLPEGLADAYPLTRTQTGMLVEMLSGDGPRAYHRVSSLRVGAGEPFSAEALRRALAELIARHEALRTSVDTRSFSVPLQLVHASAEVPLRVVDLTGADEARRERVLAEALDEESRTPLPHDRAPLMRLTVHRLADGAWQLTVTQSHLVIDGWTFATFRDELLGLYRAFRDGSDVPAHEPPSVRFADTVAAELRALASDEDRSYWHRVVTGHAPFTLPDGWGDAPGTPRRTHRFTVPLDEAGPGLRALAAAAGAPLKSVLLAAHLTVLGRLTPERRFHTGLVTHCRPEAPGAERVYGTHLNTLPFPAEPTAPTWTALVDRVFRRELEVWPHRNFPMPAIQHDLAGGGRLVEVYFSYEDFDTPRPGPAGPRGEAAGGFSHDEFPLTVTARDTDLVLAVDGRAVSEANGRRLASMYRQVLAAMATDPDGDAQAVFLPDGERDGAPAAAPAAPAPDLVAAGFEEAGGSPLARFEEWARRTPAAPALTVDGVRVPYAGLDAAARRIAGRLRRAGVTAGRVVGLLLDRGADFPAALLGTWKAGAAYLPLDPSLPAERLAYLLADSGTAALVTTGAHAPAAAGFTGPRVLLDTPDDTDGADGTQGADGPDGTGGPQDAGADGQGTGGPASPDPDGLAYVIYTSGSTGRPKGVQVTHRGLAHFLDHARRVYAGDGGLGAPLFASVAFDMAVASLLAPLTAGRPVHVFPQGRDLDGLGAWLEEHGPFDFLEATPGQIDLVHGGLGTPRAPLAGTVVVGGETVTPHGVVRARALAGRGGVLNSYGPTEATVVTHEFAVPAPGARPEPQSGASVPIGRPLPYVTARVLDARLRPVPRGVTGELHVGGPGVARGYLGRPALTAERFVPDPYGAPGARLYRTGDLVRERPDGSLDFLGRDDGQVKVRGHRVEPGEVEAALTAVPGVTDARVLLRGDRGDRDGRAHRDGRGAAGEERLVAYLVGDAVPAPGALREALARSLPAPMVPAAFVTLDALPLDPNGKLDRRALPLPDDAAFARRPYEAPRTGTERRLAAVWERLLDAGRIGRDDRFFALGGHSLLALRAIAEARRAGLPLSLLTIYRDDRLAAVAAEADEAVAAENRGAAPPSTARRSPAAVPGSTGGGLTGPEVPGASLAVIADGELVAVEHHGVTEAGGGTPITSDTLFQVGSLSKLITAVGAVRLAQEGVVDLDEDVARSLRHWSVPDGVTLTLRQLLGHLAGLEPTPSTGQDRGERLVELPDLLHGRRPDLHPAVRSSAAPGTVFRKANVHFSVVQQVLADATGEPFDALMRRVVFEPFAMADSSFDQSFPERSGRPVAVGHGRDGRPLPGGWRRWPDTAAAGLWTTATDVARVLLEIRRSRLGRPLALLGADGAGQLLTPGHPHSAYGLGTVVDDLGSDTQFGHGGSGAGYHALAMCRIGAGTGFAVLTNGDAGAEAARHCVRLLEPGRYTAGSPDRSA
uniref:non-ribosomal peptide synthetase n=1 Tax=Streptomyces roseolilacinus TaxID=66904 RepID=UPI001E512279|nr:non-ribosomal peptide synthetase [Streptomyces roseolilacinus]